MGLEEQFITTLLVNHFNKIFIDKYSKLVLDSGNVFTNNSALISGGAVYWNYNEPKNIKNQSYSNNSANKYGNNYAWFAQSLQTITQSQYNSQKSKE